MFLLPVGLVPAVWLSIVISGVVLVAVTWAFARYNGLVRARKRVEEAWSGIDVQLRRRASLLPNLEEIVKGYAAHEREVQRRAIPPMLHLDTTVTASASAVLLVTYSSELRQLVLHAPGASSAR